MDNTLDHGNCMWLFGTKYELLALTHCIFNMNKRHSKRNGHSKNKKPVSMNNRPRILMK